MSHEAVDDLLSRNMARHPNCSGAAFFADGILWVADFFGTLVFPLPAANFGEGPFVAAACRDAIAILGGEDFTAAFLAPTFAGETTAIFAFLRAAAGSADLTLAVVAPPLLGLAMAFSHDTCRLENSIDALTPLFQVGVTKLIADGLPTLIRIPVGIRVPVSWSMWNTVISSLSWLAA